MRNATVCIGISAYQQLSSLAGPVRDAEEFFAWAVDAAGGGVVDANRAHLITSNDFNPDSSGPVLSDIYKAFTELAVECVTEERVGGRLILFFAGHGIASANSTSIGGLVTPDANPNFLIATDVFKYFDFFERAGSYEELIFVFDCCRSVDVTCEPVPPPLPSLPRRTATKKKFVALGGQYDSVSREHLFPEIGVHGYLTRSLLDGLGGAAGIAGTASTNAVLGSELKRFAHSRLDEFNERWRDVPEADIKANERHDVTFPIPRGGDKLLTLRVFSRRGATVYLTDGNHVLVDAFHSNSDSSVVTYRVPVGLYKLAVDDQLGELFSLTGHMYVRV